jgi:hypothetical protein
MRGLFFYIGETFRMGNQGTRIRGIDESFEDQKKACFSHIKLLEKLEENNNKCDVIILSYKTKFDKDLIEWYNKYLIDYILFDNVIGYENLYQNIIARYNTIFNNYDYIFICRIDILYKQQFYDNFMPPYDKITFPFVCWYKDCVYNNCPRVCDIFAYIPIKYIKLLYETRVSTLTHHAWYDLKQVGFNDNDIDVMINTYHDSDSAKDWNPLYYIVNRNQTEIWHSRGLTFKK